MYNQCSPTANNTLKLNVLLKISKYIKNIVSLTKLLYVYKFTDVNYEAQDLQGREAFNERKPRRPSITVLTAISPAGPKTKT
jgi:hypothetical protein